MPFLSRRFRCAPGRRRSAVPGAIVAAVESLEPRLLPASVTGYQWSDTNVSVSILPDGTPTEGYTSNLFAELDAVAATEVWQREFARALQTWANETNLNFHFVTDNGSASGTSGAAQGDSRFGDIRLGAHPLSGYVAWAYYPSTWSTLGGDITLNPDYTFRVGTHIDLYSVLLHEVGHALGLGHSTSGTVMYHNITGVYSGLSADDVAGIRSIYGVRQHDTFDQASLNDALLTATVLALDSSAAVRTQGDLTSLADVDYYRFAAPQNADGTLTVSVDARNLSLLAGAVSIYDAAGNLLAATDAGSSFGGVATLTLAGVAAGQEYILAADGAAGDVFGMGAYVLDVQFGVEADSGGGDSGGGDSGGGDPPASPDADRFEVNDDFSSATDLGRTNSRTEAGLTIHTAGDSDVFRFQPRKSGTFRVTAERSELTEDVTLGLYDANHNLVASGTSQAISASLSSGEHYFVRVAGSEGGLNSYDLTIERSGGGGGGPRGGKGGRGHGLELDDTAPTRRRHGHDGVAADRDRRGTEDAATVWYQLCEWQRIVPESGRQAFEQDQTELSSALISASNQSARGQASTRHVDGDSELAFALNSALEAHDHGDAESRCASTRAGQLAAFMPPQLADEVFAALEGFPV